ncbi:hypothetical protein [Laspinema olomoucense]|nr:hypothetical protein [Laspinema sp. D3c]MCT7992575.1 hypothetical protein [Laspinema sp. D3c]
MDELDIDAAINNPYHNEPEQNGSPEGWQFVGGELLFGRSQTETLAVY